MLTFKSPPNFEDPKGGGAGGTLNTYNVIVQAGDGGAEDLAMEMVTVMVTNVDEPGTVMLSTLQPQVGASVTATLSDPDVFDAGSVEWEWFRGSNAIAGATNDSYTPGSADVGYVLRATATYMDGEDADTEKSAQVESAHAVRAMPSSNIDPVFPNQTPGEDPPRIETDQTREVAENTPAGEDIGAPVAATDADVLTYSLADADVASFSIDRATGQLKTKATLDHEGTPFYTVNVTATDPFGTVAAATATVRINVTDVNEAPSIMSDATPAIDYDENTEAGILATYTATDPENDTRKWSLSGVDAGQFDIVEADGQLTFMAAPDFESPGDANQDNVYEVTVVVTDSEGNSDELEVTVKVSNVEEDGVITLSALQPRVGVPLTATLTDPDGDITDLEWQWSKSDTNIEDATSDTYEPVGRVGVDAGDVDATLTVTATYTDGAGEADSKDTVEKDSSMMVLADTRNKAPVFPDQGEETEGEPTDQERDVNENTLAGVPIEEPVVATDSEDTALDYTLGGTDAASFSIVRTSGQLRTKAKLDYETKDTYEVEVTATDSLGGQQHHYRDHQCRQS